jgi:hypothetical protein
MFRETSRNIRDVNPCKSRSVKKHIALLSLNSGVDESVGGNNADFIK